jgi:hypothetical protein
VEHRTARRPCAQRPRVGGQAVDGGEEADGVPIRAGEHVDAGDARCGWIQGCSVITLRLGSGEGRMDDDGDVCRDRFVSEAAI